MQSPSPKPNGNGQPSLPTPERIADQVAFLGQPGYGSPTAGAARGLWRARRDMSRVAVQYQPGSLLSANFNFLWCQALNRLHWGQRLDYFAMLHDDVAPQDWWLDTLIEELEARGLDVLGVALPIKDTQGLTSLALARPDGDNWSPLCRLTMTEVHRLPETFTSEDVGHPLLLNTGCWVCRFDPQWVYDVHFTINDRIVFDRKRDMYTAQVEPEDWFFSRLCHELGLKLGATRKVAALHRGEMDFHNVEAWGEVDFDAAYVPASVLPAPTAGDDGWVFPADVDGWLMPTEARALAELARGKLVLEVGSYAGKSTISMAQTARHVHAVDPFDGRATPRPRNTLPAFIANLERYGIENVTYEAATFADAEDLAPSYDLIFIDAAHDYESITADLVRALELVDPAGLIVCHDYRDYAGQCDGRWNGDVTRAVNELISSGAELIERHATLAVLRPPALIRAPFLNHL